LKGDRQNEVGVLATGRLKSVFSIESKKGAIGIVQEGAIESRRDRKAHARCGALRPQKKKRGVRKKSVFELFEKDA